MPLSTTSRPRSSRRALRKWRRLKHCASWQSRPNTAQAAESWDWELDGSGLEDIPTTVGILTVKEAAELLRVSETNVYELVQSRQLPAMRVGRQIRIGRRGLVAFLHGLNADEFDALITRRVESELGK